MPQPVLDVIKVKGHFYAVPVDIHMSTWIWYSKAAFKKAGIDKEPATPDELFAALDKLKAAGLVGLAHGGQPWQENILFQAMLANVGGKELYLQVLRDRNPKAISRSRSRKCCWPSSACKAMSMPARPTATGTTPPPCSSAARPACRSWATGPRANSPPPNRPPARTSAAFPASAPSAVPDTGRRLRVPENQPAGCGACAEAAGHHHAGAGAQLEFNKLKGSLPILSNVDASGMDMCAQAGMAILKDKSRAVGMIEVF
jgi:glucose/mannose transport system substrate-binding protein